MNWPNWERKIARAKKTHSRINKTCSVCYGTTIHQRLTTETLLVPAETIGCLTMSGTSSRERLMRNMNIQTRALHQPLSIHCWRNVPKLNWNLHWLDSVEIQITSTFDLVSNLQESWSNLANMLSRNGDHCHHSTSRSGSLFRSDDWLSTIVLSSRVKGSMNTRWMRV